MNIHTVAENLRNTIKGKEKMLEAMNPNNPYSEEFKSEGEVMARRATIEFLKINIAELRRILVDVEKCVEKDIEQSWRDNPERMGR
jgi:ABC-type phosphate transport system ATPase subunit